MRLPLSLSGMPERKVKKAKSVKNVKVERHWGYMSKQLGGGFP